VKRSKTEDLNLLLGPLLAAQGIRRWKGYRIEGDRDKTAVSATRNPEAAEQALASLGFVIRDEPAGGG
jgi:hypothetical protein